MTLALTAHQVRSHRGFGLAAKRRRMPRQAPLQPLIREYGARLLVLVDATVSALRPLINDLPHLIQTTRADAEMIRVDVGESKKVAEIIRRVRESLGLAMRQERLEQVTQKIFDETSAQNKRELGKQIKAALGVDVLIRDPKLQDRAQDFVASNVSVIKTIPEQMLGQVEQVVYAGIRKGVPAKEIAEEIDETFDVGKKRAARIARDQIGSLYGQLNAERQQSIGIKRFIWRTVRDDRVREEHEDREKESDPKLGGEPYSYDDPPDGELPGEPINCRCHAEPVFSDILDAV